MKSGSGNEVFLGTRTNYCFWIAEKSVNYPVLCHYNSHLPIEVHTDGSLKEIGGILFDVIEGKLKPFYFVSYVLKGDEVNYSAPEIEVLSIVRITTKCRKYLYGKKFNIFTDCKAIQWLHEKQSANARILRWALHMQTFDYIVKHREEALNFAPDALSSYPLPDDISGDNIEQHVLVNFTIDNKDTGKFAEKQVTDIFILVQSIYLSEMTKIKVVMLTFLMMFCSKE